MVKHLAPKASISPRSPIWDITGANWVDNKPNPRFAVYASAAGDAVFDKEKRVWSGSVLRRPPSKGAGMQGLCILAQRLLRGGWAGGFPPLKSC